jgi:hypothetical protein
LSWVTAWITAATAVLDAPTVNEYVAWQGPVPSGAPANPTVSVRWLGAQVALPTVGELSNTEARTTIRGGGAKMRLGDTARTWAGFSTPWNANSHAGRVRRPRSLAKTPVPSITLVTTRGAAAGGPGVAASFSALKADRELTSGNPAAD